MTDIEYWITQEFRKRLRDDFPTSRKLPDVEKRHQPDQTRRRNLPCCDVAASNKIHSKSIKTKLIDWFYFLNLKRCFTIAVDPINEKMVFNVPNDKKYYERLRGICCNLKLPLITGD